MHWKQKGENPRDQIDACEQTIQILIRRNDKELTKQYLQWVLRKNPEIGMKYFENMDELALDQLYRD